MRAVRQDRDLRSDLLAGPEIRLLLTVLVETDVCQGDALYRSPLDDERAGRVAVIDLHSALLGLLGHELDQARERDRDVAAVVHPVRHHARRNVHCDAAPQEVHVVALDRDHVIREEAALVLPSGQQLIQAARLKRGPRKVVVAIRGRLVDDNDGSVTAFRLQALPDTDRRRQAGRAGTHDQDIYRLDGRPPSSSRMSPGTMVSMSPTMPKSA